MKDATHKAIAQHIEENGGMDAAIDRLTEWNSRVTLVSFDKLPVHSPSMLRTLASFAEALSDEMGEELSISMAGISRDKTREEKVEAAIEREYWNDRAAWEGMDNE